MGSNASTPASSLFGATRQAVLSLFFTHPDERFYMREIVRRTGCGVGAVQRELEQLSQAGILTRLEDGNRVYYSANRDCPIFPELQGLMVKTVGVVDQVRNALGPLAMRIRWAFIYGSFARGEQGSESDVDVMVVGDVSFADVVAALRPVQDKLARQVNPTIYPVAEFRQKLKTRHHFLTQVLRQPKILLQGSDDELEAMAGLVKGPLKPLPKFKGGQERVDISNRQALYDVMEEDSVPCTKKRPRRSPS